MAKIFKYTTLDRILSKLYRDLGLEEISEMDVIEWTGEALEHIGHVSMYEEAVAFIEVKNHQVELPNGLHQIIQVAKNNKWTKNEITPLNVLLDCDCIKDEVKKPEEECKTCSEGNPNDEYLKRLIDDEVEITPDFECTECGSQAEIFDCSGCSIPDSELSVYRPYFDLQYEYSGWMRSNLYQQAFSPVRLANHSFFNSIVCREDPKIYCPDCTTEEYTIVDNNLRLSFKEGEIALAYHRQKIDPQTGYPMIPDEISIISAISAYITMKYMTRLWYLGREGYGDKVQKSEIDWQWYCKQSQSKMKMLRGVDEYQNLADDRYQMIPRKDRYYGFFGKLGRPESTNWKDSDGRNRRSSLRFRGN